MQSRIAASVCPHDCPNACALDVDVRDDGGIGRIHGAAQPFTAGIVCAKVARYAEVVNGPNRLTTPLRRDGPKGSGRFATITWDEAMTRVADAFADAIRRHGSETVWPYHYAGTMGRVQRAATNRLRGALGLSRQDDTICSSIGSAGWAAGIGAKWGIDPREMAESDLVVLWGCNAAATQVNTMHWITRARRERQAKLVVVDPYRTPTAEAADVHLALRPGTDAALACAVIHVLLAEGFADRDYLARLTDFTPGTEAHFSERSPAWAAAITGLDAQAIVDFARLYGRNPRSFLRLGYGFSRQRNGAEAVFAVTCLPAITGAWQHAGGGALLSSGGVFSLKDDGLLEGPPPATRVLDMSRIGAVLAGERADLGDGPPVTAMLVQNSNPALVAPDSNVVRRGLLRDDFFLVVHEQRMTETAMLADIVLPATTMLEHDDFYVSYGHTFLQVARAVIPPVGESRSNHRVTAELGRRLGGDHPAFALSEWEIIDRVLRRSGHPGAEEAAAARWIDCALPFRAAHFLDGFGHADRRFHFFAGWPGDAGDPRLPDHRPSIEEADERYPFRLVTAPSRHFLNSSFNGAATSRQQAGRPRVFIHPDDGEALGIASGDMVRLGSRRGEVVLWAERRDGQQRGVLATEGLWPAADHPGGIGINALTGADRVAPKGGAAFHDTAVWLRREG